jgi:hypothetical protein
MPGQGLVSKARRAAATAASASSGDGSAASAITPPFAGETIE